MVASIVGLLLILAVAWPGGANTKERFDQITCFNNLRQIGQAFQLWGNDHGDGRPWRVPMSMGGTGREAGGGAAHPLGGNTWFQFTRISNELATPRILACPADLSRRPASGFGAQAGELAYPSYRNNSISYFLGLETYPETPNTLLAGDRNLRVDSVTSSGCSSGIQGALPSILTRPIMATWTNGLHDLQGNVLLNDGSVWVTIPGDFRRVLLRPGSDDNGLIHLLIP